MSAPTTILEAQVESLLALVEQHRAERCRQLLTEAEEKRSQVLREAHREARRRMHTAIETERLRGRDRLDATRAQLQTRARQQQHKSALLLLRKGWELLGQAALRRWKSPAERRLWVCELLRMALKLLPHCAWVIEHPPGWDSSECDELQAAMLEHCGAPPRLQANQQLHAGLRVCADGACLDGSLEGLLADRDAIEAQLLAEVNRLLGALPVQEHPEGNAP